MLYIGHLIKKKKKPDMYMLIYFRSFCSQHSRFHLVSLFQSLQWVTCIASTCTHIFLKLFLCMTVKVKLEERKMLPPLTKRQFFVRWYFKPSIHLWSKPIFLSCTMQETPLKSPHELHLERRKQNSSFPKEMYFFQYSLFS